MTSPCQLSKSSLYSFQKLRKIHLLFHHASPTKASTYVSHAIYLHAANRIVPLHPSQQPLPSRPYETKYQCRRNPIVPPQGRRGLYRIFQGARRRVHSRQLCHHLRTSRRDDGLWLPSNNRIQDPSRVHHPGIPQARDPGPTTHCRHKCRLVAIRGYSLPQERGLP